jgi:hypothetical protein
MEFRHVVIARMYEHIEPIDRGARYEDPLQAALDAAQAGQVTGGGSQLNENGGIDYVDIEIEVANLDGALRIIGDTLAKAGAPQASELVHADDGRVLREFGAAQCLAIYLDGVSLPDEVYASLDFEAVVEEIATAAGADSFHGYSQGAEETGLFYFGADAEEMFARVEPVLGRLPIGQNARVVIRHGKRGLNPRELRMPGRAPGNG